MRVPLSSVFLVVFPLLRLKLVCFVVGVILLMAARISVICFVSLYLHPCFSPPSPPLGQKSPGKIGTRCQSCWQKKKEPQLQLPTTVLSRTHLDYLLYRKALPMSVELSCPQPQAVVLLSDPFEVDTRHIVGIPTNRWAIHQNG